MKQKAPIKPAIRPHCYICARHDVELTDDHIPPKSFFLKGDRNNLFVAPLCEACHRPLCLDDEVMRYFLSMVDGVSQAGKRIWFDEADPLMRSKPILYENVKRYFKVRRFLTINGIEKRIVAGLWQSRAIPFIRRLTKGFLYLFHPDYDYYLDNWTVVQSPFLATDGLRRALRYERRGSGVFDLWYGLTADTRDSGVSVYRFYDATCFVCFHSKREDYKQRFPRNYKEWHKLPEFL